MNQNFAQIIAPPFPILPLFNNYSDLTITRIFPYPQSIQMLTEFSSVDFPVNLRYRLDSYNLGLSRQISTKWEDFTFLLERHQTTPLLPETKEQAELTINQFDDVIIYMYEQCSQPRNFTAVTLQTPVEIRQLITNVIVFAGCIKYRTQYLRTHLNNLHRRVKSAISKFKNERWNNFVKALSLKATQFGRLLPTFEAHKDTLWPSYTQIAWLILTLEMLKLVLKVLEDCSYFILVLTTQGLSRC